MPRSRLVETTGEAVHSAQSRLGVGYGTKLRRPGSRWTIAEDGPYAGIGCAS